MTWVGRVRAGGMLVRFELAISGEDDLGNDEAERKLKNLASQRGVSLSEGSDISAAFAGNDPDQRMSQDNPPLLLQIHVEVFSENQTGTL